MIKTKKTHEFPQRDGRSSSQDLESHQRRLPAMIRSLRDPVLLTLVSVVTPLLLDRPQRILLTRCLGHPWRVSFLPGPTKNHQSVIAPSPQIGAHCIRFLAAILVGHQLCTGRQATFPYLMPMRRWSKIESHLGLFKHRLVHVRHPLNRMLLRS